MKQASLTNGLIVLVDDEDYERVCRDIWWLYSPSKSTAYAAKSVRLAPNRWKSVAMHRLIVDAPQGILVDHRDGNGLNNQKFNLRLATNGQNRSNSKKQSNTSSKFKGVCWSKKDGVWCAQIKVNKRQKHLGSFNNELEAARAYNKAAQEAFGEFAKLNDV